MNNYLYTRGKCPLCRAVFVRRDEIQVYCWGCLQDAKKLYVSKQKLRPLLECKYCKDLFFSLKEKDYCSIRCQSAAETFKEEKYKWKKTQFQSVFQV